MMAISIGKLKGITRKQKRKLKVQGVADTDQLLKATRTQQAQEKLAGVVEMPAEEFQKILNQADLLRIKGVGAVYSDLLIDAGINTVKELSQSKSENLIAKLVQVNTENPLTNRLPSVAQVEAWKNFAAELNQGPPKLVGQGPRKLPRERESFG